MKKVFNKFLSIVLILSVLCTGLQFDKVVASSNIKISDTEITIIKGKGYKLKVTGTDETVKWYSSNTSVATVNKKGKVVAIKKGKCKITAKVSGKKLQCKVTVKVAKKRAPVATKKPSSNGHTVYITATGKKYHYDPHCNGGTYYESTLEHAKQLGLTPCKKCVK